MRRLKPSMLIVQAPGYGCALLLAIAVSMVSSNVSWAIVLSDSEQDHVVQPGQPEYGVNLDGLAALGAGAVGNTSLQDILVFQCSGALISDQHVLTAAHCLDQDHDGEIDIAARAFEYVAGFQLADRELLIKVDTSAILWPTSWPEGETDIAILPLVEPAPREIPRYALYGGRDEIGKQVVLAGYGATGFGDTGIDEVPTEAIVKRAGLNRLESFFDDRELELGFDFDSGDPAHNALSFLGETSDLGFGADEVLTASGDSGGPVFIGNAIAGVAAFNTGLDESDFNDQFDQSWGEAGFATRVSSFRDFITTATDGQAIFVPEPAFGFIALCLSVFLTAQARPRPKAISQGIASRHRDHPALRRSVAHEVYSTDRNSRLTSFSSDSHQLQEVNITSEEALSER